jgi:hypothetical protein
MRLERHHTRSDSPVPRCLRQTVEHRAVPKMQSVEVPDGQRNRHIGAGGRVAQDEHELEADRLAGIFRHALLAASRLRQSSRTEN